MWRRVYLLLLGVRLYFALSPSYIHPDEHFQGPEVIAGEIFGWKTLKTWEFTSAAPIRSFFPLWFVYGIPMQILDWVFPGTEPPKPIVIFYFLRILFFVSSFVLEDWALQDLLATPRQRQHSLLLIASSYVTWTYQTHTFSNSVETIAVLWSLVLMQRISRTKDTAWISSGMLGSICAFGVFNRITFPGFLLFPAFRLLPYFLHHPFSLLTVILFAAITSTFAVGLDTLFYNPFASLETIVQHPVITPLNNILYNSKTSNVAQHGLHLRYSHFLFNLPQLLGPAFVSLLLNLSTRLLGSLPFLSSFSGIAILSVIAHQEARFLIPTVPLLLAVTPLPGNLFFKRIWIVIWILFNTLYGLSIGSYHQAGIIPAQAFLASYTNASSVVFWKTYNPPTWLFGAMNDSLNTTALMGAPIPTLINTLIPLGTCAGEEEKDKGESFLAAPLSAPKLDDIIDNAALPFRLDMVWSTKRHLNMDDLGFGDDGIVETVKRVVGRRGLGVWKVQQRNCSNDRRKKRNLFNDW